MTDTMEPSGQRDRSPAYPIFPLGQALERLAQFETHFKRSAARPEKVGDAWGIKGQAYVDRMMAALRYFGLLEYQGTGKGRTIAISEIGRNYLRAQQEETKRQIVADIALRPKAIAKFWAEWGSDRPADDACLDQLMMKHGFSEAGARGFLKVYDATIAFAKSQTDDKVMSHPPPPPPPPPSGGSKDQVKVMEGERELTTGMLSKGASFRLIVSGDVGVKEIERLIAKLELDKEILAEPDIDLTPELSQGHKA